MTNILSFSSWKIMESTPFPTDYAVHISTKWTNKTEARKFGTLPQDFYSYNWQMEQIDGNTVHKIDIPQDWLSFNNSKIAIPAYAFRPGKYILYPNVKRLSTEVPETEVKFCPLLYIAKKPIVVVSGGSHQTVPPNTEVTLSAEGSSDPNLSKPSYKDINFEWSCKQKKSSFCKQVPVSTDSKLVIPARHVLDQDLIEVTLKGTTKDTGKGDILNSTTITKTIEVKLNTVPLEIVCEKNCPPKSYASNYHAMTFFRVYCSQQCEQVKNDDYVWTIKRIGNKPFDFDYEKSTQFGRNLAKFVIEKDTLKPGTYLISVRLRESHPLRGYAEYTLNFAGLARVSQCQVRPKKGDTVLSSFNMLCLQKDVHQRNVYEFYAVKKPYTGELSDADLIAAGPFPTVSEKLFNLPISATHEFILKVKSVGGASQRFHIKVEVTSTMDKMSDRQLKNVLDKIYPGGKKDNILEDILSDSPVNKMRGFQRLRSLIDVIVDRKFKGDNLKEFLTKWKFNVVEDMLSAPLDDVTDVLQMTNAISKLVSDDALPESDPLFSKFTTTFCKKMMDKHLEMVQNDNFPFDLADKVGRMSSSITACLETNTNPNYKVIKPLEDINITTEAAVIDEPLITENYENYEDFGDDYYKNLDYLRESTYNIVNASAQAAKTMAFVSVAGERFSETEGRRSKTVVAKDYGYELVNVEVKSHGVTVVPSQDFQKDKHSYDILLTTWSKDIMWWNPPKTRVTTDIASVQIWHSSCKQRVRKFEKPAQIYFEVRNDSNFEPKSVEDTFVVPGGYQSLTGEPLDRIVLVRRVAMSSQQAIDVEFDISDVLEVVFTKFEFPTSEHFTSATTIGPGGTTTLRLFNDRKYDIWGYVGVLANKTSVTKSTLVYNSSYIIASCLRWIDKNNSWVFACKSGQHGNSSVVHCECNEFSVLAGYLRNIDNDLQKVEKAELELELQRSLIIFITVATTFGLYLLLLLFTLIGKKYEVYFLPDNDRRSRFAYLVVIKTGFGRYASTSSNVTIRLIGTKMTSMPHVLNYPDPKMRILQRNNREIFVVTTSGHLGDIVRIELWFDCVGPNPDWDCRFILVYDIQTGQEWYFNVKKRLAVTKGESFISLTPTQREHEIPKKKYVPKFRIANHSWNLFQRELNFGYPKKLTVIFSSVFMTFSIALFLHVVPDFALRDSLDKCEFNVDVFTVLVGFMSAFVAFTCHIAIAYCFRFSKVQFSRDQDYAKLSYRLTAHCWLLLIIVMSVSISLLVIAGFWVPPNRSWRWLTSSGIGIAVGAIIYETVFLFFISILWNLRLEKGDTIGRSFKDVWKNVEEQRWFLHKKFGDLILRPYFRHLYQPLDRRQVTQKQMVVERRRYVISELEDLVMFGIYVVILYVVVWSNKDSLIIGSKKIMQDLMDGTYTRSLPFSDIETPLKFYEFLNETLVPAVQPSRWYGNYVVADPGLMLDMSNKIIGVTRLRQQRIKRKLCKPPEILAFLNMTCEPEITWWRQEKSRYGYSWGDFTPYLVFDRLQNIWQYSGAVKTGTFGSTGEISSYTGGGYVGYLGRTLYNTYANLRRFLEKLWIDQGSRSIFIEFLTYNANYNVFNSIKLLYEQSASGYNAKTVEVNAVRMLFVKRELESITVVVFFMFIIWVGVLFFKQSVGVIRKVKSFYKDPWFMVDCVIIFMSVICVALFVVRMKMIGLYLDKLEKLKHNEFSNYFFLFYLEDFLQVFAATLVCIATVRLWKFLRFGLFFRILEFTIWKSLLPLFSFSIAYILLLFAFALPLVLLCGSQILVFNKITRVVRPMFTMALSASDLTLKTFLEIKGSAFYIVLYGLIVKIIFLIYIMIIMMSYSTAQMKFSNELEIYTIKNYVQERFNYFPKYVKYKYKRLRSGQTKQSQVEPKPDKFVYSNSFSLETFKMLTMKYIVQCVFRNMTKRKTAKLSEWDLKLMLGVSRRFLVKAPPKEVEVFFKGRISGKKISLIDERNVWRIADVVGALLEEKHKEKTKEEIKGSRSYEKCVTMIKKNQSTLKKCDLKLKLLFAKFVSFEFQLAKVLK
ncbi:uncharacterized protein LOC123016069 isoform X2 [Tribolium madens]|uniref:uncharacterized protein LOC123016069 isoform X2 n=1 Tax=Tribolium madens TaxID=41895 RepID=UPI001CF75FFC|nr:uncharacterized protein LOC123016069 isoform X2 [Tribolium madens]